MVVHHFPNIPSWRAPIQRPLSPAINLRTVSKILTEAAKEVTPYLRELNRQREIQMIESVKAKGMTVTDMTKEERARMREHLKAVTEKYTREVGEDLAKEVHAEIDKARVSLAGK